MLPGWSRIEIAGKSADVFTPEQAALPFSLIWLPDLGNNPATDSALTAMLRDRRFPCVSPHGGRSWWVDRVCSEFDPQLTPERHLLDNVLPWIASSGKVGPRGIALAGVGMGGQGAVRVGLRHPTRFPIVGGIASEFDFHERYWQGTPIDEMYPSREYARQDTAILHVHPHDWPPHIWFACSPDSPWYRGNDRMHEKLAALGVPHTAELETLGPPEQFLTPLFDFLIASLERESRRLM